MVEIELEVQASVCGLDDPEDALGQSLHEMASFDEIQPCTIAFAQ
jgi:hypothetical protein